MIHYNIHTHHPSGAPAVLEIINILIKDQVDETDAPYRSYGIHPAYIYNVEEQLAQLRQRAALPQTVALGEAGLDKLAETNFTLQQQVFKAQALVAEKIGKPLIIHCVKAWQELSAIKKEIAPTQPWIIHGFRGKPELAEQLIAQGFYLSFGSRFNPEALQKAWPDRLLAETDEAETSIQAVYRQMADALSLSMETISFKLAENTTSIFCFFK